MVKASNDDIQKKLLDIIRKKSEENTVLAELLKKLQKQENTNSKKDK